LTPFPSSSGELPLPGSPSLFLPLPSICICFLSSDHSTQQASCRHIENFRTISGDDDNLTVMKKFYQLDRGVAFLNQVDVDQRSGSGQLENSHDKDTMPFKIKPNFNLLQLNFPATTS
jgi:hypothetical protein